MQDHVGVGRSHQLQSLHILIADFRALFFLSLLNFLETNLSLALRIPCFDAIGSLNQLPRLIKYFVNLILCMVSINCLLDWVLSIFVIRVLFGAKNVLSLLEAKFNKIGIEKTNLLELFGYRIEEQVLKVFLVY